MMSQNDKRTAEINLRAVASLAEALAEELRNGGLWEGDCSRKIGAISEHLSAARNATKNER